MGLTYFATNGAKAELQALRWNVKNLEARRDVLVTSSQEIKRMQQERSLTDSVAASLNRFIPAVESPDLSYAYFDKLAKRFSPSLDYRFKADKQEQKGQLKENRYTLKGKGSFSDISRFLHAIENSPAYFRIHRLHLEQEENWLTITVENPTYSWEKEITFTMEISGYSTQKGCKEDFHIPANYVRHPEYALFSPPQSFLRKLSTGISIGSEDDSQNELPRILAEAFLVAISGDVAYLRDSHGELQSLRQGDEIFEGEVTQVNIEEGFLEITSRTTGEELIFRLSKSGMWGKR